MDVLYVFAYYGAMMNSIDIIGGVNLSMLSELSKCKLLA